ncbi:MAG: phage major capsid protein [Ilumatobacteraceae bacterium]
MTKIRSAVETIESAAVSEGRDLTDAEQADADALLTRADAIRPELDKEVARVKSVGAAAEVLNRMSKPAVKSVDVSKMTAGEWFSTYAKAQAGDDSAAMKIRTVADQLSSDVTGILPAPIVGEVIKLADDSRPVFSSFTSRPMPQAGASFTRPRVTQRVDVGVQETQKTEGASRKMTITGDTVSKVTYTGVLDISQQSIDWTDPSMLDLAIADFIGMYANVTELAACDYLISSASASAAWSASNVGTVVTSVLGGVAAVYASAKRMPDTLWLSLDESLSIAGLTNTNNDVTAMQMVNTALREAGLKIKVVVGPQLDADTRILGASSLVESFEQTKGILQAVNVPLFGLDIGYAGYVAFNTPPTSKALVKLI